VSSAEERVAGAGGDADLAAVGRLLADRARARILLALDDGRALPASVLASEAGVSPSTASAHLGRLVDGGLLRVEPNGRHRYYRLAGPQVGRLVEVLASLAPAQPVRSLRESTRAAALRRARTCYDHLAGRLGTEVFGAMVASRCVSGGDGCHHPEAARADRLSAPGRDLDYRLTETGRALFATLGVPWPVPRARERDASLRYCVDWTEQRHHLAGGAGRALTARLVDLDWVRRTPRSRVVHVTETGARELRAVLGVEVPPPHVR